MTLLIITFLAGLQVILDVDQSALPTYSIRSTLAGARVMVYPKHVVQNIPSKFNVYLEPGKQYNVKLYPVGSRGGGGHNRGPCSVLSP